MTTNDKPGSEFLFVPIISAVLLILVSAWLVWTSQVRPTIAPESVEPVAQTSSQQESPQILAGDPALGQELFTGTCAACHGQQGEGIQGLGKDMTSSQFIADLSDAELIEFIKVGRDPSDPLNTTGIGMPSKGGNPSLSDDDLQDIVAFLRAIQK